MDEKDFRTMQFMDWFIKEQCEEEKNAEELIAKYERFGKDPVSLFLCYNIPKQSLKHTGHYKKCIE